MDLRLAEARPSISPSTLPSPSPPPPPRKRAVLYFAVVLIAAAVGALIWFASQSDQGDESMALRSGAAQSPTGENTRIAAQRPTSDRSRKLFFEAQRFRTLATADIELALVGADCNDQCRHFRTKYRGQDVALVWSYFFGGAMIYVPSKNESASITSFYNPYVDLIVHLLWDIDGGHARIVSSWCAAGGMVDGNGGGASVPRWLRAKRTVAEALGQQTRTTTRALAAYLDSSTPPVTTKDMGMCSRILDWSHSAVAMVMGLHDLDATSVGAQLVGIQQALANGDAERLQALWPEKSATLGTDLISLPSEVRASFVPVFPLLSDKRLAVVMVATAAPRWFSVLEWSPLGEDRGQFELSAALVGDLPSIGADRP